MDKNITERVLGEIESSVAAEDARIEPLPCDKWLVSSSWQKSVRRGQTEIALRAATTFWHQDRRSFYRRCLLVVIEDIGPGDIETVVKVLAAYADPAWRRRVGDLKAALHITRLMCVATKCRLADQVYHCAERAPEYAGLRTKLAIADDDTLADYILHKPSPLVERTLAAWYLAGMKHLRSDRMPPRTGSIERASEVLKALNVPADLTTACIAVLTKTQYPLALFMPLLAQAVQEMPRPLYVGLNKLSHFETLEGIPLVALDVFTRTGQACYRQLRHRTPALKEFSPAQIGLGVFYLEGGMVDKELTGSTLEDFKHAGEIADIESSGLCMPRYLGLRDCLAENMETLRDIRREQLQRYLNGAAE